MKIVIIVSVGILSTLGAFVPYLWGDDSFFGGWSILFSTVGGLVGIWLGYKIGKRYL